MSWCASFQSAVEYEFREFCKTTAFKDPLPSSLQDYLAEWLERRSGEVVELTGNDPDTWLEVVLIVINAHDKDPSILDYKGKSIVGDDTVFPAERRVERILDFDNSGARFLDRRIYRQYAAGYE